MFDVTPNGPYSRDTVWDNASMPAFAAETWAWKGLVL